jgi:hypothetical protein
MSGSYLSNRVLYSEAKVARQLYRGPLNKRMIKIYNKSLSRVRGYEKSKLYLRSIGMRLTGVLNCSHVGVIGCKEYSVLGIDNLDSNKSIDIKNPTTAQARFLSEKTNKISSESKISPEDRVLYSGIYKNLQGAFIFINSISTGSHKTLFLYYDATLKQISYFSLHVGANYYKHFQMFIKRTLLDIKSIQNIQQSEQKVVIAPVNYVNKTTIEKFKDRNLAIILYKVSDQNLPEEVAIIRKQLRNNQSSITDNKCLANIVSMINVRLADKGLFSQIK